MTKAQESGENAVTDEAKRETARTGQDVCDIFKRMLKEAKRDLEARLKGRKYTTRIPKGQKAPRSIR